MTSMQVLEKNREKVSWLEALPLRVYGLGLRCEGRGFRSRGLQGPKELPVLFWGILFMIIV